MKDLKPTQKWYKPYRPHARVPWKQEDEGQAAVEKAVNIYKLLCPLCPHLVWVSDFTYINYQGRFIYVATIMDRYTREIIGIAISRFHDKNLVMEAFMDAEKTTGTAPVYLHSDQGSEYRGSTTSGTENYSRIFMWFLKGLHVVKDRGLTNSDPRHDPISS